MEEREEGAWVMMASDQCMYFKYCYLHTGRQQREDSWASHQVPRNSLRPLCDASKRQRSSDEREKRRSLKGKLT